MRQAFGEMPLQLVRREAAQARGNDVGHKLLLAAGLRPSNHRHLAHRGVLPQRRFDLARLDPAPQDLDLVVETAQKLEVSIGETPHPIPGSVQP